MTKDVAQALADINNACAWCGKSTHLRDHVQVQIKQIIDQAIVEATKATMSPSKIVAEEKK